MTGTGLPPESLLHLEDRLDWEAEGFAARSGMDLPSWPVCVAVAAAIRLVGLFIVPVLPEESYHWLYARHLDFGYYDHPPMVAWMIALGTAVFGHDAVGIRIVPWLFSIGTSVAASSTAARLFGEKTAAWMALLLACQPVTLFASSFGFPDSGLLLFWTLSLSFAVRALQSGRGAWWLAAGASLGAALLSKYTAAFLGLSLFLFLIFVPQARRRLKSPWPWMGAIASLVVFSPVIFWNAGHDWASFRFQSVGRLEESTHAPRLGSALVYVFQQVGGVMALAVPAALAALWEGFRHRSREQRFLLFLSMPLLLFFLAIGTTRSTHVLWPLPAWIALTMLTADYLARNGGRLAAFYRNHWREITAVSIIAAGIGLAHTVRPLPGVAPLRHVRGWGEIASRAARLHSGLEAGSFYLAVGRRYVCPSQLAFHLNDVRNVHSKNLLGEEGLQFSYWADEEALRGRDAVVVAEENWSPRLEGLLREHFQSVEVQGTPLQVDGSASSYGRKEERYVFYLGHGYRPHDQP